MHQAIDNKKGLSKVKTFFPFFSQSIISFFSILYLTLPCYVNAALSPTTHNTIIGNSPYFTLDGGLTKINNGKDLLNITLTDKRTFKIEDNPSTPEKPIELPEKNQSFANITTLIPKTLSTISFNDLVHDPYHYGFDQDGDYGISATGDLTMKITDVWGKSVKRSTILSACNAPYKLTLSASGVISTTYGDPRSNTITPAEVSYYIRPKVGLPIACWAQPNLVYSSTHPHPTYGYTNLDGPETEWNPNKGYLLQSLTDPSKNFPTMGAYGLFFKLIIADGNVKQLNYTKYPTTSNISLTISEEDNSIAKVMVIGPRNGASKEEANKAVPTTFTLYSDTARSNPIYTFTIGKWFIATPGKQQGYNANFCNEKYNDAKYGNRYRIPKTVEYTNANDPITGWTGGLAGQPANFQRRIGGGLFSEWGNMDNHGRYGAASIYQESDFDDVWYWAAEKYDNNRQRYVDSYGGWVSYSELVIGDNRFACVTP